MPGRVVPAVGAGTGVRVAVVRMAVAFASTTVREVPEAGFALATGATVGVGPTLAPSGVDVAEVVESTDAVAVAGHAALGAEAVGARGAAVATTSHHVRLARTGATVVVADQTVRARWVALACLVDEVNG